MQNNIQIGFIGAGNMARALIGGMLAGQFSPADLHATDPHMDKLAQLRDDFALQIHSENQYIADNCDVIVLAVKPQSMQAVVSQLDLTNKPQQLLISIAAGITTNAISRWAKSSPAIVRAMPNTPALVQAGATGLYANAATSAEQREYAQNILAAVGVTVWLQDETLIDAVTAISGSGPAYFFYFMEILQQAAMDAGLDAQTARQLSLQTAFGAAKLAQQSQYSAAELRRQVTSPGGTTEAALRVMKQEQMATIINNAVQAAQQRARELSEQLEN